LTTQDRVILLSLALVTFGMMLGVIAYILLNQH